MNLKTIQGMALPPKTRRDLQLHPGQLKAKPRSPQLSMGGGGRPRSPDHPRASEEEGAAS